MLAEERRLFDVGMTHAKNRLRLIDERRRPSPFIHEVMRHAPPRLLQVLEAPIGLRPGDRDIEGLEVAELGLEELWSSFPAQSPP